MFVQHTEEGLSTKKLEPSLQNLAHLLRHKELWPEGFSWYYPKIENCAIGLAKAYWGISQGRRVYQSIGFSEYHGIFLGGQKTITLFGLRIWSFSRPFSTIMPEDVAREIELVI